MCGSQALGHSVVVGLDHEGSNDTSKEHEDRMHERSRVQLLKANHVAGPFTSNLGKITKGLTAPPRSLGLWSGPFQGGDRLSVLVFQAEFANPDVNVIAVNDPFKPLGDMVYNSSTTVSAGSSTAPSRCPFPLPQPKLIGGIRTMSTSSRKQDDKVAKLHLLVLMPSSLSFTRNTRISCC